MSSKKKS